MAMPVVRQWNQQLQDQLQALIDELPRYLYFISIFLVWCLLMYECFLSRIVPHELLFEAIKSYYKLKRSPLEKRWISAKNAGILLEKILPKSLMPILPNP